ncbi:MAG: DarT ssDNA thymidine ADP-ribosyltransferase family protein [Pseudanabaena sp.]
MIEKIGIINSKMATKVKATLANVAHKPVIAVEPNWYF